MYTYICMYVFLFVRMKTRFFFFLLILHNYRNTHVMRTRRRRGRIRRVTIKYEIRHEDSHSGYEKKPIDKYVCMYMNVCMYIDRWQKLRKKKNWISKGWRRVPSLKTASANRCGGKPQWQNEKEFNWQLSEQTWTRFSNVVIYTYRYTHIYLYLHIHMYNMPYCMSQIN